MTLQIPRTNGIDTRESSKSDLPVNKCRVRAKTDYGLETAHLPPILAPVPLNSAPLPPA
ncbi:MAG: hypothetical protein KF685_08200 [Acidobacteria bacterium]|nr:hypothetical protein [Acidobacteriota bacterium]